MPEHLFKLMRLPRGQTIEIAHSFGKTVPVIFPLNFSLERLDIGQPEQ